MRILLAIAIAASGASAYSWPPQKDDRPPGEQILGDWRDCRIERMSLRLLQSESVFLVNGKPNPADGLTATYSIDWSKKPVAIDFVPRNGNGRIEGILKLEGDQLTLAIPLNKDPRPTSFDSAQCVLRYQRIRK